MEELHYLIGHALLAHRCEANNVGKENADLLMHVGHLGSKCIGRGDAGVVEGSQELSKPPASGELKKKNFSLFRGSPLYR